MSVSDNIDWRSHRFCRKPLFLFQARMLLKTSDAPCRTSVGNKWIASLKSSRNRWKKSLCLVNIFCLVLEYTQYILRVRRLPKFFEVLIDMTLLPQYVLITGKMGK